MTKNTLLKIAFGAAALLLLAFAVEVVLLIFASILVALMLHALSKPLAKRLGISEQIGLVIVVVLLVVSFTVIGWLIAPSIGEQVRELRAQLPATLQKLQQELSRFAWLETLFDARTSSSAGEHAAASTVTGAVSGTLAALGNTAVVVVIALYLAFQPKPYINGLVRLFPVARRERAREVLYAMGETLRWWLIGKGLSMVLVGIAVFIGLTALGVPLAATLALIAALLDFIPNIGPLLAAVPAALFALLQGPAQALYVIALFVAIQSVEGYVLTPLIEQRTVSVPPALSLAALVVAGLLFGWLGLLLAAPATAALLVFVQMVYLQDTLGERDSGE
ncbi:MAG: AI-2E family transporter [Burkholderiaceae bacterium]|nr:AI-2E family transporter [Burkholderiaceae bacterium]